jgi:hypothetical protein
MTEPDARIAVVRGRSPEHVQAQGSPFGMTEPDARIAVVRGRSPEHVQAQGSPLSRVPDPDLLHRVIGCPHKNPEKLGAIALGTTTR